MKICFIDKNNQEALEEVFSIQMASYQVEADLIGYQDLPPLKESVNDLMESPDSYLGVFEDGGIAKGFATIEIRDGQVFINKLAVTPVAFRKGIGKMLISAIIENYHSYTITVRTAAKNLPARRLYESFGLNLTRGFTTSDGLQIVEYVLLPKKS